ncbi:MAG: hypothetical protein ACR2HD_06095 [Solirubrobacteraceae bacterium]|nr:MAG: hypothetical protein DLM63_08330 [Solirubrobacterales bacterium]
MTLPQYVDYGSLVSVPAPFVSLNTTLHGFWFEADRERLEMLCRKIFHEPSGGAVDVRPISGHLMISWGQIAQVISQTPPFDRYGGVAEPQVAVWLPAARVRQRGDQLVAEHFFMCVPYIWLDNAMSLATGRELFGYPKAWGWLGFPAQDGTGGFTLDAFGLDYGRDELAARHPLLELVPTEALSLQETVFDAPRDVARDVADHLYERDDEGVHVHRGLRFLESVIADLLQRRLPTIFLKQFRSIEDGRGAALQQIVTASCSVTRLRAARLARRHQLTVHDLDSHPVGAELGLESQPTELAYKVEMDFEVGGGEVLWDAAR